MPRISVENLRKHFKTGDIDPVYVLYGSETYLRDRAVRAIAERCFGEGDLRDFNDTIFSLQDVENIRDALAAADQLPMMAARRVIRITDVRVAASAVKDTLKEEFEKLVAGYLEKPNPSSVVIFVGSELNGNRKMTKLLGKHATVVEFAPLDDKGLSGWIERLFVGEGVTADPEAIRHLTAISGSDLVRLSSEIKKLAAASLPSGRVTTELIDQLVPRTREIDSFSLTGHLINRRPKQAAVALKQMLDDGAEPLMMLGLIGSNYRRLIIAKEMMKQGRDSGELARAIKLPPSVKEPFLAAARRTEMPVLIKAIDRIAGTDVAIKNSLGGGTSGARMQIEMLVCELAAEA